MNPVNEPCTPDEMDRLSYLMEKAIAAGQLHVGYFKSNGNSVATSDPETRVSIVDSGELLPESIDLVLPVDSLMGIMQYEIISRITNPEA